MNTLKTMLPNPTMGSEREMGCRDLSESLSKYFFLKGNREKSFMLKIVLRILPELVEQSEHVGLVTHLGLYERFVREWFEHSQERLEHIRLTTKEEEVFTI